jgi:(1->4)-alpha-D-glucan 1-alpha-D-glucosylmutase
VQLSPAFGFDEASAVADYLAALGVTHLYASPYLQAAAGSTHGYDVVDHSRVNAELGGEPAHARMCARLTEAGLGQVIDIVPNHMAITSDNRWWWDVLENGPSSLYASYFDVDWDPPEAKLRNTVLLPVLGDHYGRVLEAGEIVLAREGGSFVIRYHVHLFPVAPRSLDELLATAAEWSDHDELASLATAFGRLPLSTLTDRASVEERHRDKEVLRARLDRLCDEEPDVAATIDAVVRGLNADPDALDALLERQNYRLAFWRTAGRELDYRRFFDITSLVGLRVEDPSVFTDSHALVLEWVEEGIVDGLRVDHPDGLRDPAAYLRRLSAASGGTWVAVEKILEPGEALPAIWPVAGTTGYDFLNLVLGLFVDPAGEEPLTRLFVDLTGCESTFEDLAREQKRRVLAESLAADLNRLTELLVQVGEGHRRYRDYTRHELRQVLAEIIVWFPVYRTYADAEAGQISDDDRARITDAVAHATAARPDIDADLFSFVASLLTLETTGKAESELVMRFQQTTGPVMAKGVEDTAFYLYNRLVALNEVGGDPSHFGTDTDSFHRVNQERSRSWPVAMLATSTHDTKRSEDVRARLALLSEIPDEWAAAVRRWFEVNGRHRHDGSPDANAEYLLYQTLVGAWPLEVDRAVAYIEKATREANAHTSWTDPNPDYDDAVRHFTEAVLADADFTADLRAFVEPLVEPGWTTSLAQTLVKLTSPGVPDIYQGTELWDLSLVDPDNRRPVDFARRRQLLADLDGLSVDEVWKRADKGLPKLWVTRQALAHRSRMADSYEALSAIGEAAAHVVAFSRGDVVTVVPRLVVGLARSGGWRDTEVGLPDGEFRDVFSGAVVPGGATPLASLLGAFPVALLVRT